MQHIKSAGIILTREEGDRYYLLLFTQGGTDFPKGHIEKGETPREAALRETAEETGIKELEIIHGYLEENKFFYMDRGRRISKSVTFFLGVTSEVKVTVSWEHKGFKWCTADEAVRLLRHKNQKDLIRKAEEFFNTQASG